MIFEKDITDTERIAAGEHTVPPVRQRPAARTVRAAVFAVVCLVTLLVFLPLRGAEFLHYDDNLDVTENIHVRAGLTWDGLRWAATSTPRWIPLTWLSHMVDCELFGLDPGAHHLTSVAWHVANTALLLYVLLRLTGALWPSAFVTALFALHPLHVEPVAWIAARPHLLCTAFWLAAILAYVRYTERRTRPRYLLVCLCMLLSLLSRSMAVTLPLTLLLLDYWPLRRWPIPFNGAAAGRLLREKLPLLILAAGGALVQVAEQRSAGSLASVGVLPISWRIAHAILNYTTYVSKMFWPVNLAIEYPLQREFPPAGQIVAALAVLTLASIAVTGLGGKRPYLVTGWLWYLITLLPVTGLLQMGHQTMADRYTYVPLIGLFLIIAWGAAEAARNRPVVRAVLSVTGVVTILLCGDLARRQIGYWHDGITLFRHTLAVTADNSYAEVDLGAALAAAGQHEEARAHFTAALRIDPYNSEALNNMGVMLAQDGHPDQAEAYFQTAAQLQPRDASAHRNWGLARLQQGNAAGAREQFEIAVALAPQDVMAHAGLAQALEAEGRLSEALAEYERVIQLDGTFPDGYLQLAQAEEAIGHHAAAVRHYREALRTNPNEPQALDALRRLSNTPLAPAGTPRQ